MATATEPIPGPPPLPILGNLLDLDRENTIQSWVDLAGTYGPIYKMRLAGADRLFVTGHELVDELCSRRDFVKIPVGVVRSQKELTPEGLFTADHGQESWERAHRVLVPAFGPLSIRNMFAEMHDMISQLALKWARFGDESPINVTSDFTRLTLDTIALCAMDMRFNSFYSESLHPFVDAMTNTFSVSQQRSVRPAWLTALMWKTNQGFADNKALLHDVAAKVIARRRANPSDKKDLVNAMLKGRDPATGEQLSDDIIMDNMITFLIAGHETTSGLLSFVFAFLMLNPDKYKKVQQEIDSVLGNGPMTPDHLSQLPYIKACLREALRLQPPVAGFSLNVQGDQPKVVGNKWLIKPGESCVVLLPKLQRDPSIFGDDVDEFRPERMLEDNFTKLPPNCYKPFGNGTRQCIGSDFALQEAIMATAILMQKFDFNLVDPDWKMKAKQTATLKPDNLFMYAKLRPSVSVLSLQRELFHSPGADGEDSTLYSGDEVRLDGDESSLQNMSIFYGSNTGTCEGLADRLATSALQRGFRCTIKPLNEAVDEIPTSHPVVFISSTHYEGQPPDNAAKFMPWLDNKKGGLDDAHFAVFGCGNREWKETFQSIPTRIEAGMKNAKATPLATRGVADAGEGNMIGDFDTWLADQLWPGITKLYGAQTVDASIVDTAIKSKQRLAGGADAGDLTALHGQVEAKVKEVRALTADEDRPKYHIEIELPEDVAYEVGDYLDVYPHNSTKDVERLLGALRRQGYDETDSFVKIISSRHELNQPASAKQLESLVQLCANTEEKTKLDALAKSLADGPAARRPSILHLLTTHPSIALPPASLAAMLPPIRPRPYSISSSPLASPTRCSLTWSLLTRDAVSEQQPAPPVPGLASHYLAALGPGAPLSCAVRPGQSRFRPPPDPRTPLIMVCAGAGVAPFAGFVAHRAELARRDPAYKAALGPAVLYVGCRGREQAALADALRDSGVVDVRYAFSRGGGADGEFAGYVQDRLWAEREEWLGLWARGARMLVCGSQAVSLGVKQTVRRMYREAAAGRSGGGSGSGSGSVTEAEVEEWWVEMLRERYAVDVF